MSPLLLLASLCANTAFAGTTQGVLDAIHAWDIEAAEELLADATGNSDPLHFARGLLRSYQGDYPAALEHFGAISAGAHLPEGATFEIAAAERASRLTEDHIEVRSPDGHWRVRYRPGKDAVLLPVLWDTLPRIRNGLGERFGLFPGRPVLIEIYPDPETLAEAVGLTAQNMEDSGTIAICKFNRILLTSPNALLRGYGWVQTLAHEYIHLLINKISRNRLPIWLHEGIAKYHEGYWEGAAKPKLDAYEESLMAIAIGKSQLITFDEMSPSMALLPTQKHAALAFAEVQTAIAFLLESSGEDAVRRLLGVLADGAAADDKAAIAAVTGDTFARFEKRWKRWLKKQGLQVRHDAGIRKLQFRKSMRSDDLAELDSVDSAIKDYLRLGELLRGRGHHEAGLIEYKKALRETKGVANPYVHCKIASAHLALKQPQAAKAALAPLPRRHPGYSLAYTLLGEADLELGQHRDAKRWMERSLLFNPYDPAIHHGLLKACAAIKDAQCQQRATVSLEALRGKKRREEQP